MVKLAFDIPKEMLELAQDPSITEHPYDLCFICPAHTVTCDGPNELAMTIDRYVEWNNQLAKRKHMTRQQVADAANLPLPTVAGIMTLKTTDPRHSTTQAISKAVSGGCWGQYPCHIAAMLIKGNIEPTIRHADYQDLQEELADKEREIEEYKKALDDIHTAYKEELETVRAEAQRKIDHLLADNAKKDAQISKLLDKLLD